MDLILTINQKRPSDSDDFEQNSVQFYDDAYYWFLYPLFEALAEMSGQIIDLYQDALFEADTLPLLKETVQKAKQLVDQQPDEWLVRTGTLTRPINKDLVMPVRKEKFLARLDRLEQLINAAIDTGENILCFGD